MSSLPKMPAINEWLARATSELAALDIPSARLDAEVILAHTIRKPRTYLHAHPETLLDDRQREIAEARLELRKDRTPIAYITGHKEFYGRRFKVTPATLIPRPESETIITFLKELLPPISSNESIRLVDIGTGSGALGITAKLELPFLDVTLTDISRHALKVAAINAKEYAAEVTLLQSDLLASYPLTASVIIANLPYVDPEWERSPETDYEPPEALFAKDNGLYFINKLLKQAPKHLIPSGFLILEADPRQYNAIIQAAKKESFEVVASEGFVIVLRMG